MADTSNQPVDPNGVPQDNSTFAQDDDTPLNSAASATSGAAPSGLSGARADAASRYSTENSRLTSLQSQADALESKEADAYAQQKKVLEDATNRLLATPVGPTDQEKAYRLAASYATPGQTSMAVGAYNRENAEILKEQREAELQKQALIMQYQGQIPASIIGQVGSQLNQNLGQQRIASTQTNNAGNAQFKRFGNDPWYVARDAQNNPYIPPQNVAALDQTEIAKTFGKVVLKKRMDGGVDIVSGAQTGLTPPTAPRPQVPGVTPPQVPSAPAGAPAAPPRPVVPPAAPAAPGAPASPVVKAPTVARGPYDDMFIPSTVLDPKYSPNGLTDQTKPTYVATATQAFDPSYFNPAYKWEAHTFQDPQIYKAETTKMAGDLATKADASEQMLYNYGHVLSTMDANGNDATLLTGPVGERRAAFENAIRGISPSAAAALDNDPDLQRLASSQEIDKYARAAALTGLKAIFQGRITNQEMQQRMKTLPSTNLLPAVTRMLAQAQAEQAQDVINQKNVFAEYTRRTGDPNKFQTFYDANFSPFKNSLLHQNLATRNAPASPSPVANNPLLTKWLNMPKPAQAPPAQ
jgi:hypothetical protein